MSIIISKTYNAPPFCEKEALRYAGCKSADSEIAALLNSCLKEVENKLIYKVCYRILPLKIREDICDFGAFKLRSKNLAENLKGSERAVVFAATVGIELDRLIAKYSRISPSKALMLQAIGAERIETLADTFCEDIEREIKIKLKPRFSPGYGDLPLASQRDIFALLESEKRIGLFLNESMLMSPSKSVTAFAGIRSEL